MSGRAPRSSKTLAAQIGGGVLALVLTWALGLWPAVGQEGVSASVAQVTATQDAPAWVARLGLSGMEPFESPNPRFDDQLSLVADTPAAAALRADLCSGAAMQPDRHFREVRRALAHNDGGLCSALADRIVARSPVIVAVGPGPGWALLGLTAAVALGLAGWGVLSAKHQRDRWRLVGRSTFGATRRAGSG